MKRTGFLLLISIVLTFSLSAFDNYVDITNDTGFPAYYVYISPHGTDSWGQDLLGKDAVINNGETLRIHLADQPSTVFDIKMEDVDGDSYTMTSVDLLVSASVIFTPENMNAEENELLGEVTVIGNGGPINGIYYLYNNSSKDILYIQIRKESGEWSPDLLGENDVFTNKGLFKIIIRDMPETLIDLRFEDKRGHTYTYRNVDLSQIKELIVEKEDRD